VRTIKVLLAALAVVLMAGCHRVDPPVPVDQLNAQQTRGHEVFQAQCARCHNDRKDAPLNGPALIGVFKKPYLHSGAPANNERVTDTVLHGHGLMPALGNNIDQQQLDDLLAYLHTL
jgi:mono/diheme cytochrome c family protein